MAPASSLNSSQLIATSLLSGETKWIEFTRFQKHIQAIYSEFDRVYTETCSTVAQNHQDGSLLSLLELSTDFNPLGHRWHRVFLAAHGPFGKPVSLINEDQSADTKGMCSAALPWSQITKPGSSTDLRFVTEKCSTFSKRSSGFVQSHRIRHDQIFTYHWSLDYLAFLIQIVPRCSKQDRRTTSGFQAVTSGWRGHCFSAVAAYIDRKWSTATWWQHQSALTRQSSYAYMEDGVPSIWKQLAY